MIRRPPRSTPFPTRRSSDLVAVSGGLTFSALAAGGVFCSGPNPRSESTRLNSSHSQISYAVFCLKKKISTDASLYPPHYLTITTNHTGPHTTLPTYIHNITR